MVRDLDQKYDDVFEDAFYQAEEVKVPIDSSFGVNSLKMFARKLICRNTCRPTRSENAQRPLVWVSCEQLVRLYVVSPSPWKSWNPCQLLTTTTSVNFYHVLSCPTLRMHDAQVTHAL